MDIHVYRNILAYLCVNIYVYTYLCSCTTHYLSIYTFSFMYSSGCFITIHD